LKTNLQRKSFTAGLKANVPLIKDFNTYKTNLLLQELGLFPLHENVQASLEDDKYLNIKLKDLDDKKHLTFQFQLEENDLSALEARPDYQELQNRYHLYINAYMAEVKKYAVLERAYLQERFPDLVFNIKIRIKSYDSYINKLNENISKRKKSLH